MELTGPTVAVRLNRINFWTERAMTFSASAFLQTLEQETARLSKALHSARAICIEAGRPDIVEWIDLELHGYKGKGTLFAYRRLAGVVKGVITNGEETLYDYVIRETHLTIAAGIDDLLSLPGLQEALQRGQSDFIGNEDHDTYADKRILSASKPGYRIEKAWSEVPLDALPHMVHAIGERLETVLAGLHRKPSWW